MPHHATEDAGRYWFARHSKSIIFLVCILGVVGVWEALTLPVSVFPATNFPRIIIGVDNGVTPIEQMEAAVTRPLEEAVRAVPGLENVRSVTGRGTAEINLFFNWKVDMLETLQLVDAAVSRVQSSLPPTAQIQTHRLDFSSFPIIGYSLVSKTVPQKDLWELATYEIKPRLNRLPGVAGVLIQGGQKPEFHVTVDPAAMLRAKTSIADVLGAINKTNIIDSPGLLNRNHELYLGLITGQVHSPEDVGRIVVKHAGTVPVHIRDLHATMLHLFGIDHMRLTYKVGGLDSRLTGVLPARVIEPFVKPIGLRVLQQDAAMLAKQTATVKHFGGEQFVWTEIDVLGKHIWRLMRAAERGEAMPADETNEISLVV